MTPERHCTLGTCYGWYEFELSEYARQRHTYVVGTTGAGKTTLLLNMIAQDMAAGRGLCVIDPHGDLARATLSLVPSRRAHEVVVIDPSDAERPVGFNPIMPVAPDQRAFVANNVVAAMRHIWADSWGARLEHLLFNGVLALQAIGKPNLVLLQRLFTDDTWRRRQLADVDDVHIRGFWQHEFEHWPANEKAIVLSPALNKVGRFTQDPYLRNMIAQQQPHFDLARSMDEGRIVVVNLAKGRIGKISSHLLGAFFVTCLAQAAWQRDRLPADKRTSFTVYADEFQSYATDSFAAILSEARKYNVHLTMAHQYLRQVPDKLLPAILGNVATVVALRVSGDDAHELARHLGMKQPDALLGLANNQAFVQSLSRGGPTRLEVVDMAPPPTPTDDRGDAIARNSRIRFGMPRAVIEASVVAAVTPDRPIHATASPVTWPTRH